MFGGDFAVEKIYNSVSLFCIGSRVGNHDDRCSFLVQFSKEFHHFFPQAFLRAKGVAASRISSLANMVYLSSSSNKLISDRAPSEYVANLLAEYGAEARAWLATNLIDEAAINAALADDYDTFVSARANVINERAKTQAGWIVNA